MKYSHGAILLLMLLYAQAFNARSFRVLTSTYTQGGASARSDGSASASSGTAANGVTGSAVSAGVSNGVGTRVNTGSRSSGGSHGGAWGSVATRGAVIGSAGSGTTSSTQTLIQGNSATATGTSFGNGLGTSSLQGSTRGRVHGPFGPAVFSSNSQMRSNTGGGVSAAGAGSSGPGGLVSNSIAIGVSGEVASSNVDALATVSGGYGEPASFFKGLGARSRATAVVNGGSSIGTGSGNAFGGPGIPTFVDVNVDSTAGGMLPGGM